MVNIIGVLGARNSLTKQIMQDEILNPVLDDLVTNYLKKDTKIAKILLPEEPLSSSFIECWANRQDIPVELIKSEWGTHGRKAGVLRDARIEKESTILIVFEGPKSRYYVDLAERIAKRRSDCLVYVVNSNSVSPVLLEVDQATRFTISDKDEEDILKTSKTQTLTQMWSRPQASTKCLIQD